MHILHLLHISNKIATFQVHSITILENEKQVLLKLRKSKASTKLVYEGSGYLSQTHSSESLRSRLCVLNREPHMYLSSAAKEIPVECQALLVFHTYAL